MMALDKMYANVEPRNLEDSTGPQRLTLDQDEGKDQKQRGRRRLVLMTVSLGLICVLLLLFIIWMNITITAERDLVNRYKTTVQEFNHTINSLQTNYTDLRTEKDQLKKSLDSLSQKNQQCETRVKDLSAEKEQLQQKKLELERNVTYLSDELKRKTSKQVCFFLSNEAKSWSESRQFCWDYGADLVMIKTEEKQRLLSSLVKERVWIGLTDAETEGNMTWVDNSPLTKGFWAKDQPNNQDGIQDCVEMKFGNDTLYNWNDRLCSAKRKGICEK